MTAIRPSFAYSPAPNRLGGPSFAGRAGRGSPGTERCDGHVAHLVAQHLQHPAAIQRGIGELRRENQVRVEIGAGVVRRVDPRPRTSSRSGAVVAGAPVRTHTTVTRVRQTDEGYT